MQNVAMVLNNEMDNELLFIVEMVLVVCLCGL